MASYLRCVGFDLSDTTFIHDGFQKMAYTSELTVTLVESPRAGLVATMNGYAEYSVDYTLLTPTLLVSMYPDMTCDGVALARSAISSEATAHTLAADGFRLLSSASKHGSPCEDECPVVERHVRGRRGFSVLAWGGIDGARMPCACAYQVISDMGTAWWLADSCNNEKCSLYQIHNAEARAAGYGLLCVTPYGRVKA
ncbi:hypothetical protein HGRIS_008939 [Hohenbuehelia grisea]|uniref:Uncharacterized protein n=1 Tax=Hohenbuehelia grisea TaxID=104357 RepID=A0ABR3IZM8_9AGAR